MRWAGRACNGNLKKGQAQKRAGARALPSAVHSARDGVLLPLSLRPGQATQHCKGMDAQRHEKRSTRLHVRGGSKTDLGRGNVVQGRHDNKIGLCRHFIYVSL